MFNLKFGFDLDGPNNACCFFTQHCYIYSVSNQITNENLKYKCSVYQMRILKVISDQKECPSNICPYCSGNLNIELSI